MTVQGQQAELRLGGKPGAGIARAVCRQPRLKSVISENENGRQRENAITLVLLSHLLTSNHDALVCVSQIELPYYPG